jgi:hypothetical protein
MSAWMAPAIDARTRLANLREIFSLCLTYLDQKRLSTEADTSARVAPAIDARNNALLSERPLRQQRSMLVTLDRPRKQMARSAEHFCHGADRCDSREAGNKIDAPKQGTCR